MPAVLCKTIQTLNVHLFLPFVQELKKTGDNNIQIRMEKTFGK